MKVAAVFGLVSALLLAYSGDGSAYNVAKHQPMKLAAMEGLYNGGNGAPLVGFALLDPDKKMGDGEDPYLFSISVPKALSFLATRDFNGFVPGIEDIINGGYTYTDADGVEKVAIPFEQKRAKGLMAIEALKEYNRAANTGNDSLKMQAAAALEENFSYFGYGYLESAEDSVPPVALTFYAFRVMVILGGYFILFFIVILYMLKKGCFAAAGKRIKWFLYLAVASVPLVYICSQSGWIVAEVGRQPWTIQDLLPVQAAVSGVSASNVYTTVVIFFVLFTVLLVAELKIMFNQIKKGFENIK